MTTDDKEWYEWSFKNDKKTHKLKTDEELLQYYCAELMTAHAHWLSLLEKGCNDPFWTDGTNINLVRNHIIFYRKTIINLCHMRNLVVPECYYEPVPPKVDENYMANLHPTDEHQVKRLDRVRWNGQELTSEKPYLDLTPQLDFIV